MIWDIDASRRLAHAGSVFELAVRFRSDAARVALLGASGSGKSQTLRMIAGLSTPERGRIVLSGRTLFDRETGVDQPPRARRLAYVFQDYALFPHLTVRQNIAFALRTGWFNPGKGARHPEVEKSLAAFGLESVADHPPHRISGGQRQRVALARALIVKPAALLLDEPFAALDNALRRRLREELLALQETLRIPMLLITHDEEDAAMLAQEVVTLDAGKTAGTVRTQPV